MAAPLRALAVFLFCWSATAAFVLLLLGVWDRLDLMGAVAVGFAAAAAATVVARVDQSRFAFRLGWLRLAASVPHRTVVDFGILTRELARALVRREPRRGVFRAKPFDAGQPAGGSGAGWRAFIGVAAGYSPNAYVVELDPERRQVLVHDLVPDERSEAPA